MCLRALDHPSAMCDVVKQTPLFHKGRVLHGNYMFVSFICCKTSIGTAQMSTSGKA